MSRADQCGRPPAHALSGPRIGETRGARWRRRLCDGKDSAMRSIIVDDEESAGARLGRMLAAYPDIVVVGEARDGLEALQMIEALEPDLVFLDIQMPGLTGFEVLQSIPSSVAMPLVIFVTGYDRHAL